MTYPSNSDPSNMAGKDTITLGQIAALDGTEVPMYTEKEAGDAIRAALGTCHWYTNRADAYAQTVIIRLNGDRMFAAQNFPTNPDAPDVTAPQE